MQVNIDKISYSKRKTLSIRVTSDGLVHVRSPKYLSENAVFDYVQSKAKWVQDRLHIVRNKIQQRKKSFSNGEIFLYFGDEYTLEVLDKQEEPIYLDLENKMIYLSSIYRKKALELFKKWYKRELYKYSEIKSLEYARDIRVDFKKIIISNTKSRWGSCSSKKILRFCWKLAMAPKEVVDYVILHEVAHLREMNHSKNFWRIVEEHMPNYKQHKLYLKKEGELLDLE